MKKSCKECKALRIGTKGLLFCDLGYKTKTIFYNGIGVELIPLEECPKPLTYSDYFYAMKFEKKEQCSIRRVET